MTALYLFSCPSAKAHLSETGRPRNGFFLIGVVYFFTLVVVKRSREKRKCAYLPIILACAARYLGIGSQSAL